ncbi:MAG: ATP-binding protein [Lachnospiraceae bacterium]|nr:ATP-binding protein [Lachnospiraceae bacterium]
METQISIKKKILIPMVVLVVLCGIAVLVSSILLFSRELDVSMREKVSTAMNMIETEIDDMISKARLAAFAVSDNQNLSEAIMNNDRAVIADIAYALQAMAQLDFCIILDSEGTVKVRTYDIERYGDNLAGQPQIVSAFEGRVESYIVPETTIRLGVIASAPIYDDNMNIVGVILSGLRLDTQNFVHNLSENTGCEVSIFLNTERIASTITGEDGSSALGINAAGYISEKVLAGESFFDRIQLFGKDVLALYVPLYGANNEIIGMIVVGYYTQEYTQKIQVFILVGVLITLLVFVACLIIAFFISKVIEQRLKNMMNEILAADEYARLMFDSTPMSCILWDENLKIINCNEEALTFFGVTERMELDDNASFSPEFQQNGVKSNTGEHEMVRKAFDEGYLRQEWLHQSKSGELLPCEATLVRVKHKEKFLVAEFLRDLREQKLYLTQIEKAHQAAEAASAAKSTFLANMSHEIRTPMNSIIGFSELAQDGDIPPKSKDYLDKIQYSAKWLLTIINDILDISKIESGKIVLERIPFDLPDIFSHCQMMISQKAEEKGIALYCYAEPSVGKKMLGDPVRLRQILINLLSNAVKFTNNGIVKLLASLVKTDANSATMHFEVKDSGIGMTSEQIEKIFEPFIQADETVTRKFGGTGLGLAITKNLLELMGGSLIVESTVGVGSKFSFDLTFDLIEDKTDLSAASIVFNEFEKPNFHGEILICEDNNLNQQVICHHLARIGIQTIIAANGKEGVDIVKKRIKSGEKQFDLIFMDIHMPIMDGLEAASKITELGIKTPIIAITANIMSNDIEIYMESGMVDTLGKPFTSQELWGCLLKYLTPTTWNEADIVQNEQAEKELRQKLIKRFVENNRGKAEEIMDAINKEDKKLAHRLAHTLKSNAGQLGKLLLQKAAEEVETGLKNGEILASGQQLELLRAELEAAITEFESLVGDSKTTVTLKSFDIISISTLFEKLKPLLANSDLECLQFISELHRIPGCEKLIRQMENFDFLLALETLENLKTENTYGFSNNN